MYRLEVFHPGAVTPTEAVTTPLAADALAGVSTLLERYSDCERIVVMHTGVRLFAVDSKGATLPD